MTFPIKPILINSSDPMETTDIRGATPKRGLADPSAAEVKTEEASALPFRQTKRFYPSNPSSSSSLMDRATSGPSDPLPTFQSLLDNHSFSGFAGLPHARAQTKFPERTLVPMQTGSKQEECFYSLDSSPLSSLMDGATSGFSDASPPFRSLLGSDSFSGFAGPSFPRIQSGFPPIGRDPAIKKKPTFALVAPQFWDPVVEQRNGRSVIVQLNRPNPKSVSDLRGSYEKIETFSPFIQNGVKISKQIRDFIRGTTKEPIKLQIAPNEELEVARIEKLGAGQYSTAYKCRLTNGETRVLKVYHVFSEGLQTTRSLIDGKTEEADEFMNVAANKATLYMANQLCRYAQIKSHPILSQFIVPFYNLDPHLKNVSEFLRIEDTWERLRAFKNYVEKNFKSGFALTNYIEEEFPSVTQFDKGAPSPYWVQVKEMLRQNIIAGYNNDLSRSNIRSINGAPVLVDLLEEGENDKQEYVFDQRVQTYATEEATNEKNEPVKYIYQDVIDWFKDIKPKTI